MTEPHGVVTLFADGVFRVRLSRPRVHNAFDDEMVKALHAALDAAEAEVSARLLLLEAEGKSFCAGADLAWMHRQGEASFEENEISALRLARLFDRLDTMAMPVVARIQGAAVGGGVGLVAASDVAVASSAATFSLAEVRLGLIPAVISPHVLRKIGVSRSRELMLTGRRIDAAEALSIGLVHRIAEPAALEAAVGVAIRDILCGGPSALREMKKLLRSLLPRPEERGSADLGVHTARIIAEARASGEGKAGMKAFLEKKPPPWAPPPEA